MEFNGRRAGQVLRYHTHPTIQRQTVAEHSWHVMRIYIEIWGPPEPHMTSWILHHDSAEHIVGDVPFGAKERIADLGHRLRNIEEEILMASVPGCESPLRDWESWRLKACDLLEMVEFGSEESLLGSTYGENIRVAAGRALLAHVNSAPPSLPTGDCAKVFARMERKRG